MTNNNGAIIQQLKSNAKQSTDVKADRINQSEILEDSDKTAYFDAIQWAKNYQIKYEEYKEQARLLISNKQAQNAPAKLPDMETLLFNELHPQQLTGTVNGKELNK